MAPARTRNKQTRKTTPGDPKPGALKPPVVTGEEENPDAPQAGPATEPEPTGTEPEPTGTGPEPTGPEPTGPEPTPETGQPDDDGEVPADDVATERAEARTPEELAAIREETGEPGTGEPGTQPDQPDQPGELATFLQNAGDKVPQLPDLACFYVTVPAADAGRFTAELAQNWPAASVKATAVPKTGSTSGRRREAKPLPFPEGVLAPIAFRKLLAEEGLIRGGLTNQMVYGWTKLKGFPVSHYADDGTAYAEKQTGPDGTPSTRPGVRVEEGRAWYLARLAAKAA